MLRDPDDEYDSRCEGSNVIPSNVRERTKKK